MDDASATPNISLNFFWHAIDVIRLLRSLVSSAEMNFHFARSPVSSSSFKHSVSSRSQLIGSFDACCSTNW